MEKKKQRRFKQSDESDIESNENESFDVDNPRGDEEKKQEATLERSKKIVEEPKVEENKKEEVKEEPKKPMTLQQQFAEATRNNQEI